MMTQLVLGEFPMDGGVFIIEQHSYSETQKSNLAVD